MKRKEIENLNNKLGQIKELERMYEEITSKGSNHWWEIRTPDKQIRLRDVTTRSRFKTFIESEIKLLKEEISLED